MAVDSKYVIGIDLGTTNSAVSYIDCTGDARDIKLFQVPQLTGPGEISALPVLPSFLYIPGEHELNREALNLPWPSAAAHVVGAFARDQGARVPKRMVSSAKSWLCHERVNRHDRILPWGADADVPKMSPVSAAAAYLSHIKAAWNHLQDEDEEFYLENQTVILTVPASFDEVARDLTVEAARQAGIENVTLLEEPLAAFYHWLWRNERSWNRSIRPGELILVCDVGGGTTDFTLITLRRKGDRLAFDRIAVGDHLILGGDNMDLALARQLEARLDKRGKGGLTVSLWQNLTHQCRDAKEKILGGISDSEIITLVGERRRLIADTVSESLDTAEMEAVVLDGFFPLVPPEASLAEPPRKGITEFGLPYAQDPAITRHLIRFLERHRADVAEMLGKDSVRPDLILFNGGALKPAAVRERIREAVRFRFGERDASVPRALANTDLDLAVALGAGYYGRVRTGSGVRVGSGSPRAYYLVIGKAEDESAGPRRAICVVERGMEEGERITLGENQFQVVANQPVSFDLFSSSYRTGDRVGDIIAVDDSVTPLPPIHTVIQFGKKARKTTLPATIEAHYTEVGTLSLWCRAVQTAHRWRLQFQLRDGAQAVVVSDREVFEESAVNAATDQVTLVYSGADGKEAPEKLVQMIADAVKCSKEGWPLGFIRRLADRLIEHAPARQRSAQHESRWLNLTGFCLRPGFGEVLDDHRIQQLWKINHLGPIHAKNPQVRSEWWVLWRRVAGGLAANQQRQLLQELSPVLNPKKRSAIKRLASQEHMEMWMLMANLERLPAHEKVNWGRILLDTLSSRKTRPQYWWALSRIGAREPLYGPIDRVVPPDTAAEWIETILSMPWRNPKPVGRVLSQLARLTGDRKRDLEPALLRRVLAWLDTHEGSAPYKQPLLEVKPILPREESDIFGESLPPGILLDAPR